MRLELIATATFGLEAVVRREIEKLGYTIIKTEDGKVTYQADERGIVRSNLWLRCADRVLLKIAEFEAADFESLFQQTKACDWEQLIPIDGKFTVTCSSVKSTLHNEPACQSIVKKAIVEKLKETYAIEYFEETGAEYTVKATLLKDRVTLTVDTTGVGLHKRGYRQSDVAAPIKETMASALIQLSFWKKGRILLDPCCGSGTIPIEAAMIAMNIAPGLSRSFASEGWEFIDERLWKEERKLAYAAIDNETEVNIYGYDIDKRAIRAARENAEEAGVLDAISFKKMDARGMEVPGENGIIITNPPYGQRIGEEEEVDELYRSFGEFFTGHPDWSMFIITSVKDLENKYMKRKADRRRKLYNGRIETCYYQFHGEHKRPAKPIK